MDTNGEKLIITNGDESDTLTFDIVEIKSNSLVLSFTDEYTSNGVQYKDISTFNFKKI